MSLEIDCNCATVTYATVTCATVTYATVSSATVTCATAWLFADAEDPEEGDDEGSD